MIVTLKWKKTYGVQSVLQLNIYLECYLVVPFDLFYFKYFVVMYKTKIVDMLSLSKYIGT